VIAGAAALGPLNWLSWKDSLAMNQDGYKTLPAFIVLSRKDIAARAYEMYQTRGASDGFDRDDWLRAEQELRARGRRSDSESQEPPRKPALFRHSLLGTRSL
jgi:Protein of unknown function (DUF2934)